MDTVEAGPSQAAAEERPAKKAKKAKKAERSGADQPYENGVLRELVRPHALFWPACPSRSTGTFLGLLRVARRSPFAAVRAPLGLRRRPRVFPS